jgi:hypothetical protein
MFLVIVFFNSVDSSVVGMIFRSLPIPTDHYWVVWFRFIYENKTVKDQLVPLICLAPLTFLLSENSKVLFFGYVFDNELIIINGLITLG